MAKSTPSLVLLSVLVCLIGPCLAADCNTGAREEYAKDHGLEAASCKSCQDYYLDRNKIRFYACSSNKQRIFQAGPDGLREDCAKSEINYFCRVVDRDPVRSVGEMSRKGFKGTPDRPYICLCQRKEQWAPNIKQLLGLPDYTCAPGGIPTEGDDIAAVLLDPRLKMKMFENPRYAGRRDERDQVRVHVHPQARVLHERAQAHHQRDREHGRMMRPPPKPFAVIEEVLPHRKPFLEPPPNFQILVESRPNVHVADAVRTLEQEHRPRLKPEHFEPLAMRLPARRTDRPLIRREPPRLKPQLNIKPMGFGAQIIPEIPLPKVEADLEFVSNPLLETRIKKTVRDPPPVATTTLEQEEQAVSNVQQEQAVSNVQDPKFVHMPAHPVLEKMVPAPKKPKKAPFSLTMCFRRLKAKWFGSKPSKKVDLESESTLMTPPVVPMWWHTVIERVWATQKQERGLWRVPGNAARIEELYDTLSASQPASVDWRSEHAQNCVGLLKFWMKKQSWPVKFFGALKDAINDAPTKSAQEREQLVVNSFVNALSSCGLWDMMSPLMIIFHAATTEGQDTLEQLTTCTAPSILRLPDDIPDLELANYILRTNEFFKTVITAWPKVADKAPGRKLMDKVEKEL